MRAELETYAQDAEIRERTRRKLLHQINRWERFSCAHRLRDIDDQAIVDFRAAARRTGLSARTIEDTIDAVRLLARWDGRELSVGRRLRKQRPSPRVPTVANIDALYRHAHVTGWPVCPMSRTPAFARLKNSDIWRAWLVVAYWTGLRLGDLMSLRWSSIKPETIEVDASKTSKQHIYPLPAWVSWHLDRIHQDDDERVFPFAEYAAGRIRRELRAMAAAAQIGPVTCQEIRRCSITQWACASPEAGRIVHGERLGVLSYYYDQHRILLNASSRLDLPDSMRTSAGYSPDVEARRQLDSMLRRLPDDRVGDLLRIGEALI